MKEPKTKQKGITLIALVISIIVMLILAGVSLNLTIGDNGIIKQAQNATYQQSCAMLEEYLQQYYVKNFEKMEKMNGSKVVVLQSMKPSWFYSTRLGYIPDSNGNALYLINKSGLPEEIRKELKGGDAGDGTYSSYAKLIDVYGVTSDLRVYYSYNGIGTMIGVSSDLLDQDDAGRTVATVGAGSIGSSLTAFDLDGDGKISAQEARSIKEAEIDAQNLTSIEEIGNLSSLETLVLKNANLADLTGIERCPNLYYIYFQNCKIADYRALTELRNQLTHLIFYCIDDNELATICSYEKGIGDDGKGDSTRNFSKITHLGIVGNKGTAKMFETATPGGFLYFGYVMDQSIPSLSVYSLEPLKKLSKSTQEHIQYLSINNQKISSLQPISGFKGLLLLRADYSEITSMQGLEDMPQLEAVFLPENKLTSLMTVKDNNNIKYLNLYNNSTLTSLAGLEKANNLTELYLNGCNIGNGIDSTTQNEATDAIRSLKGKTLLNVLDIQNNSNLKWVDYLKELNIKYLHMAGCTGMDENSFKLLKSLINQANYASYPPEYATSLIDSSTKMLDLKNQNIRQSVFESLIPTYENGKLVSGCNQIEKLNLTNLTITNDSDVRLSATEANTVLNNVLSKLTTLKKLRISSDSNSDGSAKYSTGDLSSINFVGTGKIEGIQVLDLIGVNTASLSGLNGNVPDLRTLSLSIRNSSFSFSDIQDTMNVIYNNNIVDSTKGLIASPFGESKPWAGLCIRQASLYSKLNNLTSLQGIYMRNPVWGAGVACDMSGNISMVYVGGYQIFTGCGKVTYPASLTKLGLKYAIPTYMDFSRCDKIDTIDFEDCTLSGGTHISNTFETIGQMYTNAQNAGKTPALKNVYIRNHFQGDLPNLNFLEYLKDAPLDNIYIYCTSNRRNCSNVDGLKYLTKAKKIEITYGLFNDISSIVPVYDENNKLVSGCPDLEVLKINFATNLPDIGYLGGLKKLNYIECYNCSIGNIYGIQNATALEYLNMDNNCLYNILSYKDSSGKSVNYNVLKLLADMNRAGNLRRLYIRGNYFEDFTEIKASDLTWGSHGGF